MTMPPAKQGTRLDPRLPANRLCEPTRCPLSDLLADAREARWLLRCDTRPHVRRPRVFQAWVGMMPGPESPLGRLGD
jgi:hypothetical protein